MDKKKVIFILGTGRSGSTLLDIILGNGNNIFSCGELRHHADLKGLIDDQIEVRPKAVFFWRRVLEKLNRKYLDQIDFDLLEKLIKKYEYHLSFFSLFNKGNTNDKKKYHTYLLNLYSAIFECIGENCIVDSSKYQMRALNLAEILPYQLYFIYIKRNPIGVVSSLTKKIAGSGKSWFAANLYYFVVNLQCKFACYKLKKKYPVVTIKYENLMSNPVEILSQLEAELGIDLSDVLSKIKNDEELNVGYPLSGSRFLHSTNPEKIKIKKSFTPYEKSIKDIFTLLFNYWLYI